MFACLFLGGLYLTPKSFHIICNLFEYFSTVECASERFPSFLILQRIPKIQNGDFFHFHSFHTLVDRFIDSLKAYQSSTSWGGVASRAIDGKKNADYRGKSCTHTSPQPSPWWAMDLGGRVSVSAVTITNRADCCCKYNRLYMGWRKFHTKDHRITREKWTTPSNSSPFRHISIGMAWRKFFYNVICVKTRVGAGTFCEAAKSDFHLTA